MHHQKTIEERLAVIEDNLVLIIRQNQLLLRRIHLSKRVMDLLLEKMGELNEAEGKVGLLLTDLASQIRANTADEVALEALAVAMDSAGDRLLASYEENKGLVKGEEIPPGGGGGGEFVLDADGNPVLGADGKPVKVVSSGTETEEQLKVKLAASYPSETTEQIAKRAKDIMAARGPVAVTATAAATAAAVARKK